MSALPDAVGDLGARRLGRWVVATLVGLLLVAAAAGAILYEQRGEPASGELPSGGLGPSAPAVSEVAR